MPAPASGDPLIGQVIDDRYRILRGIGRGGMGVVYEAEATRLGKRLCAVKVLLPEFTRNETAVARFAREAQVAGRVKHPNVVEIFDTGTTREGLGYIAMELLRGESLDRTRRRDGALPWPRVQRIMLQICRALAAAHAEGIVHRDMKPENCFRCTRDDDDDFIKVLDFGIAKLTDPEENPEAGRLTATNSVIGTYSYMAYEQIRGDEVDHRVDVWASGVILYELLTGQLPFRGNNQGQIWRAITEYDPAPMRNLAPHAGIPEALEAIVSQALARSLSERYPTIDAFARALAAVPVNGVVRSVTGKLAPVSRAEVPASTLGVAPTIAMDGPHPSQRTGPVQSHGLTELGPDDVVDTDETVVRTVVSPTTRPGLTELAPPREFMETALGGPAMAPEPELRPAILPVPAGRRRVAWPLVGLLLTSLGVAAWLSQGTGEAPTRRPTASLDPPNRAADDTPAVTSPAPAPPPSITPEPKPEPEPVLVPEPQPEPVAASPDPKKAAPSFAERAAKALQAFSKSDEIKGCFSNVTPTLDVIVTVAARTGVGTVKLVDGLKKGSAPAKCIERKFTGRVLLKPVPGERGEFKKALTLSR